MSKAARGITAGRCAVAIAFAICLRAQPLSAYDVSGDKWTLNRTVRMQLSLNRQQTLSDGSSSFDQVAEAALNAWNPHLAHLRFSARLGSPVPPAETDDMMSVFFANNIFGDTLGSNTLAVTLISTRNNVLEETDTIFNTRWTWDSYRGPLRSGVEDFRRVAIHEFGHTLGLDHPDEAGQNVNAIMNSAESNVDNLQADDIAGAQALYGAGPSYLTGGNGNVLMNISTRALVGSDANVLIGGFIIEGNQPATVILRAIGYSLREHGISNALRDPVITVYNASNQVLTTNDDWFTSASAQTFASYGLDPYNSIESAVIVTLQPGAYTAVVRPYSDNDTAPSSGVGLFELYDIHTTSARAGNLSSRGQVLSGDNVMIGGFIIGGSAAKEVIIRAIGPSLVPTGIPNALLDPTVSLYDRFGNVLQSNNDWQQGPNAGTISTRGMAPSDTREAAVLATLPPGNYTAIVSGVNGSTGVGLVEVFDQTPL